MFSNLHNKAQLYYFLDLILQDQQFSASIFWCCIAFAIGCGIYHSYYYSPTTLEQNGLPYNLLFGNLKILLWSMKDWHFQVQHNIAFSMSCWPVLPCASQTLDAEIVNLILCGLIIHSYSFANPFSWGLLWCIGTCIFKQFEYVTINK